MKKIYFLFIILSSCIYNASAQSIRNYIAVVKTTSGQQKGILHKVDSNLLVLLSDKGIIAITKNEIKSVKLRIVKNSYQIRNYMKGVSDNHIDEYYVNQKGEMVKKPYIPPTTSIEDEIGLAVASVMVNGMINVLAAPIQAINPNVAYIKFDKDINQKMEELSYYSIQYQQHPNTTAELKKIKEISANFKP